MMVLTFEASSSASDSSFSKKRSLSWIPLCITSRRSSSLVISAWNFVRTPLTSAASTAAEPIRSPFPKGTLMDSFP